MAVPGRLWAQTSSGANTNACQVKVNQSGALCGSFKHEAKAAASLFFGVKGYFFDLLAEGNHYIGWEVGLHGPHWLFTSSEILCILGPYSY